MTVVHLVDAAGAVLCRMRSVHHTSADRGAVTCGRCLVFVPTAPRVCNGCNEPFIPPPNNRRQASCSRDCYNLARWGKPSPRPRNSRDLRRLGCCGALVWPDETHRCAEPAAPRKFSPIALCAA